MSAKVQNLMLEAAEAEDLTVEGAVVALLRGVLLRGVREDGVSAHAAADLLAGAARLKGAGGAENPLSEMTEWLSGSDGSPHGSVTPSDSTSE